MTHALKSQPEYLTIKDVSRMLRVSDETIRRKCRGKQMPHFRLFGQIRFRRAEVDAWIDSLVERELA